MRIAHIAPLQESVPPRMYGGTERVVACLVEELVRQGHDVTLFAAGDSTTSARLEAVVPSGLRLAGVRDTAPADLLALTCAFARAHEFDVIHSHLDYQTLPFAHLCQEIPVVVTCHGRLDLLHTHASFESLREAHLVSISDNQRRLVPSWNWAGTVYNGIDIEHFTYHPRGGEYLAFLGRISAEKGIEDAIAVAKLAGIPLKIAAKVDPADREYYETQVKPLLNHPLVEYIGEVNEREKDGFLGQAMAVIFPVRWPEPFGLVMAEAMATGTPVIAGRFGSVPEVIVDGRTGFVCDSVQEMVLATRRIDELDRAECRRHAERRFSASRMAADYLKIYERLVASAGENTSVPSLVVAETLGAADRNGHQSVAAL